MRSFRSISNVRYTPEAVEEKITVREAEKESKQPLEKCKYSASRDILPQGCPTSCKQNILKRWLSKEVNR